MIASLVVFFSFFFLLVALIGPIKIIPPFSDIRQLLPMIILFILSLSFISPTLRRRFIILLGSTEGFLFGLFYFCLSLSTLFAQASEMKQLFVLIVAPGGFLVGYLLTAIYPKRRRFLNSLIIFISAIGVLLSLYSVLVFLFGQTFLNAARILVIDKIIEYQLFDLDRGRIFPLTPIEFFVAPIFFLILLVKKMSFRMKMILISIPLLALLVSNYRLKTTWGIIAAIVIWKKSKHSLGYLALLAGGALLLSSFFLTTNYVRRISLSRPEDVRSITKRVASIAKNVSLISENPFWGIGIGNYVRYADWQWVDKNSDSVVSFENPHNFYLLLATEGGLVTAFVFILLLIRLMKDDLRFFRLLKTDPLLPLYLSSWIFVANSAFDWYPANLLAFFFFLRGVIYGANKTVRAV